MKEVKNKTLKKDLSKRRHDTNDSPLRFPTHIHWIDTHERRIDWLYFENYQICQQYLTAKLLYAIAKLKRKQKDKQYINLQEYKAINEGLALWKEVNYYERKYNDDWSMSLDNSFKYHYVGDEEEEEEEEE